MNMTDTTHEQKEVVSAIEVEHVSFAYGEKQILNNVSLSVKQGDYLSIVGPNGAGKTTLIKLITNALHPKEGAIRIFGEPVKRFAQWPRIGYVPQHANRVDLSFPATVFDVVMMGGYGKRGLFRRPTKEDRQDARLAIARVGLTEQEQKMIGELSGGQTQRAFIARALVTHPDILILDEPTAGVDLSAQAALYDLLRRLNKEGMTLVVVSHDIEVITKESTHLAYIDKELAFYEHPLAFLKEGAPFLHGHDH